MKTALTTPQRQKLVAAKNDIKKGRDAVGKGFQLMARAFRLVHDDGLWIEEAESFGVWCENVADESRSEVYRMIQADLDGLSGITDNLAQARALFGLPLGEAQN